MKKVKFGLAVAAMLTLWLTFGSGTAAAQATTVPVVGVCLADASPQLCDPPFTIPVVGPGNIAVEFTTALTHCSDVRIHFIVDGTERAVSAFLAPGQSTGLVPLGVIGPGLHSLVLQAEGRVGGCNAGTLLSWGGTARIVVDETPPECRVELSANQIRAFVVDPHSGIVSIQVLVRTNASVRLIGTDASVIDAPAGFFPPTTSEQVMVATRINRTVPMRFQIRVTNAAGGITECDPVLSTLRVGKAGTTSQSFAGIPRIEHKLTIRALRPGLERAVVTVNGHRIRIDMRGVRTKTITLKRALLHMGKSTVNVKLYGKAGARALVALTD